ncbi:MAG: DUF1428 domain-containing protein [Acidobacteriota bacterium]
MNYIDGFVLPIPRSQLDEYRRQASAVAEVWKEHGALEYREFVGDDLQIAGVKSFGEAAAASDDEVVVFGWVVFESKESRDVINEKVASDPRMETLIDAASSGFDASRMAYGGFKPLV